MPQGRIGIYVGSHKRFTLKQTNTIDKFCESRNAIVICDHTSGYNGKYKLLPTLMQLQTDFISPFPVLDLMIHIGEVSAATFAGTIPTKAIWRVSEDGELRDPFKKLTCVFQMSEESFFSHYCTSENNQHEFIDQCRSIVNSIYEKIPSIPFSNLWTAMQLSSHLPEGSTFHMGVSNTRRCWNLFPLSPTIESACNVGCCGIDGCVSTLIGASLVNPDRLHYIVVGDLTFFYDLNVLGNRHIGKNLRIMVINNGLGLELRLSHTADGIDENQFIAAAGHFGNKSPLLIKHFAEDLGYQYLSASNKDDFMSALQTFTQPNLSERSIIFEVFTDANEESKALHLMSHILSSKSVIARKTLKQATINILGNKGIQLANILLNK